MTNFLPLGVGRLDEQAGIPLTLFPSDRAYTFTVQRAPDDGTGLAPATGSAVTIAQNIPGTQQVYIDHLPLDGTLYWYAVRHEGFGDTASAWTGWVGPWKALLVSAGIRPAAPLMPVIAPSYSQDANTGTVTLAITDPQSRITMREFRTTDGGGSPSAWADDTTTPYSATANLNGGVGLVEYRVTGYDTTGTSRYLAADAVSFTFAPAATSLAGVTPTRDSGSQFTVTWTSAGFPTGTTFDIIWSVDGGASGVATNATSPKAISTTLGASPSGTVTVKANYNGQQLTQASHYGAFAL